MLRVSAKVAAMPEGPSAERAVDHLQRGQSNDCYWHGLFGGIYIVHMRMATLHHLIAAEDLADAVARASGAEPDDAHVGDWDLDGRPDAVLASPAQLLTVDLDEGAGISTWDLRASRVALCWPPCAGDRRPTTPASSPTTPASARTPRPAAASRSMTSWPSRRTASSSFLHYDDHERRGALVRLLEPDLDAEALRLASTPDRVPVDAPWSLERLGQDRLDVRREVDGLILRRRLRIGGPRQAPWLEVEVEVENRSAGQYVADLGLEWSICLSGGGGNPAAFYEVDADPAADAAAGPVRSAHDGAADLAAPTGSPSATTTTGSASWRPPSRPRAMTWFPIETVSNSEGGFERVYQGSSLLFRWRLDLAAGVDDHIPAALRRSARPGTWPPRRWSRGERAPPGHPRPLLSAVRGRTRSPASPRPRRRPARTATGTIGSPPSATGPMPPPATSGASASTSARPSGAGCAASARETHDAIADQGRGPGAMAQPFHHAILPLASTRDRRTEIRWGLRDAELRFGHRPVGLWLPETAVDLLTLRIAAELGVRYTILAPWQAATSELDTRRLYRVELGSGRHIVVAFYDGRALGRRELRAQRDRRRRSGSWTSGRDRPPAIRSRTATRSMTLVATDGELYGHHMPFRDLFLEALTTTPSDDARPGADDPGRPGRRPASSARCR